MGGEKAANHVAEDIKALKAHLRRQFKERRGALPAPSQAERSQRIQQRLERLPDIVQAKQCFVYISCGSEVATHAVIDSLLAAGKRVAVPFITPERQMLAVQFNSWTECEPGSLGILTPSNRVPASGPFDLAITPGLAFTETGVRLGFGAGYYDRWFSQNLCASKVALAYEVQIAEALPRDEFDVSVDKIVTEDRTINVSR